MTLFDDIALSIFYSLICVGSTPGGAASYHLLPVGCSAPGFTSMFVSEQTQQTVNATGQHQISASPYTTTNQQSAQFQQQLPQQTQHSQHTQVPATSTNGVAQLQFAAPSQQQLQTNHLGQMTADSTPQFITLATGQPLKVMAVGPGGQLIQTAGMSQFMPSMGMGMAMATAQQPAMAAAAMPQKLIAHSQQQQQQQPRRSSATLFPVSSNTLTSNGIPLVQTASGGDDGGQPVSTVSNAAADEKLVYTAL